MGLLDDKVYLLTVDKGIHDVFYQGYGFYSEYLDMKEIMKTYPYVLIVGGIAAGKSVLAKQLSGYDHERVYIEFQDIRMLSNQDIVRSSDIIIIKHMDAAIALSYKRRQLSLEDYKDKVVEKEADL